MRAKMITLWINDKQYQAAEGQNVLQVALDNGIEIPHLCYHESLSSQGSCRLCLVEVTRNNRTFMTTSCTYPALEGISVQTDTPEIKKARRLVMELMLPLAPDAPKIKALASELGVDAGPRFSPEGDNCIKCGLCARACDELVGAQAITFAQRGVTRTVEPPFDEEAINCIGCGTCVQVCPTGCITMEDRGMVRTIDRWKRTLELKACAKCGRPFITLAEIAFAQAKAKNPPPAEWFDHCPDCR